MSTCSYTSCQYPTEPCQSCLITLAYCIYVAVIHYYAQTYAPLKSNWWGELLTVIWEKWKLNYALLLCVQNDLKEWRYWACNHNACYQHKVDYKCNKHTFILCEACKQAYPTCPFGCPVYQQHPYGYNWGATFTASVTVASTVPPDPLPNTTFFPTFPSEKTFKKKWRKDRTQCVDNSLVI